jgi:hypothetical protein
VWLRNFDWGSKLVCKAMWSWAHAGFCGIQPWCLAESWNDFELFLLCNKAHHECLGCDKLSS